MTVGHRLQNLSTEREYRLGILSITAPAPQIAKQSMMDDERQMMNDERSFATGQQPVLPHYKHWVCDINLIVLIM